VEIVSGSLLMLAGAGVIALAGADPEERRAWGAAASRETIRYAVDDQYTSARALGYGSPTPESRRTWLDWVVMASATGVFVALAMVAARPRLALHLGWAAVLGAALLATALLGASALWRRTRFV
jgi:hypothetical protein